MDGKHLADGITAANQQWTDLLAGIDPVELETGKCLGDWTPKDIAAHTADWVDEMVRAIQFGLRDEVAPGQPIEDGEQFNQAASARGAEESWLEVKRRLDASVAAAAAYAESLSLEELETVVVPPWGGQKTVRNILYGGITGHHGEHLAELESWIEGRD